MMSPGAFLNVMPFFTRKPSQAKSPFDSAFSITP